MYNKERKTKYAIRKLAVATVSLAIGSVVAVPAIVDSGQVAHAEEQGGVAAEKQYEVVHLIQVLNNDGKSYTVPEGLYKLMTQDTKKYALGETVTPIQPKQTTYIDNESDGIWTFEGYVKESITITRSDLAYRGRVYFYAKWKFTSNNAQGKYKESYRFESATPGKELPDELKNYKLVPREFTRGERVYPQSSSIDIDKYEVADGYWVFGKWKSKTPYRVHPLEKEDILGSDPGQIAGVDNLEFIGYWYFFRKDEVQEPLEENALLEYRIINTTPEYEIPQALKDLYPPSLKFVKTQGYYNNMPSRFEMPGGEWSRLNILDSGSTYVDKQGQNRNRAYREIIARWEFRPKTPRYHFNFEGAPSQPSPAPGYIMDSLTPKDTTKYKKGDIVKAKVPGQLTYEDTVNNGTWVFKGYNKNSGIYGATDLDFLGVWEFKPKSPTPTIADNTNPNLPAITKVDNATQLTQDEKDKVEKAVKDANPTFPTGTTVTVDNNGDVTITYPDTSTDTIPGVATIEERETSAKPTVDKVDTDDLKVTGTGVAGSKIEVTLPDGTTKKTTTVKPDGKWEIDLDSPLGKYNLVKVTQEETDKKVSPIAQTVVMPTTANQMTPNYPAITKVDNPAQLTQDEKDKVVDEVKKANPSLPAGTTITVDNNGEVTITYPDKSKNIIPGTSTVAEKETSAKPTVDKVDTDDTKITGTGVAGSKIVVTLPNGDTKTTTVKPDGKWEVDLDNPLAKDGEVKVTQEETGKKVSPIAPTTVVPTTAEATTPNNPAVTEVDDPTQLTQDEKDKVVDEVKKANPGLPGGTTVTVDNNGDVTITYPDKSKDTIPGINTVVKKGTTPAPVVDKVDTDDTKITGEGVVGATVEVELPDGTKKTTTVKPDGKWEVPLDNPLPKDSVVKVTQTAPGKKVSEKVPAKVVETIADKTTPNVPAVTEVENKTQLTQEEKGKVEKAVKDANPTFPAGTTVTVDNNGDVTITYPDKSTDTIPGTSTVAEKAKTPKIADTTTPKLPEVTEVEDPTQLTQDEKDKVVDKVKKANPGLPAGTTVTVGNNGDVTITYPDKSKNTIPGIHTVVKKGTTPAPVVDKVDTDDTKITGEGVVGATVEVELPDGTKKTTVVKPDGKWEVPLANPLPKGSVVKVTQTAPGKKVSEKVPTTVVSIADNTNPNVPTVTEVENKTKLTQGEKDKVVDEVKKANPGLPAGTTITVADNGDVTITYPDNSIDIIPGTKTVTEKTKVPGPAPKPTPTPTPGQKTIAEQITPKTPEVTEVGNKTKLTQGEKGKVEEAVKKANPGLPAGTKITVADNGEVTITYPDGSVDTIPGESTVKEKVKPAGEKAKALPNTGLTANNAVVAGLSILAMAVLLAARRKNNK